MLFKDFNISSFKQSTERRSCLFVVVYSTLSAADMIKFLLEVNGKEEGLVATISAHFVVLDLQGSVCSN